MDQAFDAYTWEIFFTITSICCILSVLQIFGIFIFGRLHKLLIIQKRYPKLVMIEGSMAVVGLAIIIPLDFNRHMHVIQIPKGFWTYFSIIINAYTAHFVVVMETCRLWLISFDLHYLHSSQNKQWKSQIDKAFALNDWYLQNRGKWGNKLYVARWAMAYYLIASTCAMIGYLYVEFNGADYLWLYHAVNAVFYAFPVALVCFVYLLCPKRLSDEFLFLYEFSWTAIIWFGGMGLYTAVILTFVFVGVNTFTNTLNTLLIIFCMYSPSLVSTLWVPIKILRQTMWGRRLQSTDESALSMTSLDYMSRQDTTDFSRTETAGSPHTIDKKRRKESLRSYLRNEAKFEVFVDWIYREFSSEILLSFIEFTQFKLYVEAALNRTEAVKRNSRSRRSSRRMSSVDVAWKMDYVLYDAIPQSSIVYSTKKRVYTMNSSDDIVTIKGRECDDITHCKHTAHLLFEKYIRNYAELQINISCDLRTKYCNLDEAKYRSLDGEGMLRLFDPAIQEMYRYMKQSFVRLRMYNSG